jgi:WD40 repeat protein
MDLPKVSFTSDERFADYNNLTINEQNEIDPVIASFEKAQKLSELAQNFERENNIIEACKIYEDVFRLTQDTSILKTLSGYYAHAKVNSTVLEDQKNVFELQLQQDQNAFKIYQNYKTLANPNLNATKPIPNKPGQFVNIPLHSLKKNYNPSPYSEHSLIPLLTDQPNFIANANDFKDSTIPGSQLSSIATNSYLNQNSSELLPFGATCCNFEKAQELVAVAIVLQSAGKIDEAIKVYQDIFNLTEDWSILEIIKQLNQAQLLRAAEDVQVNSLKIESLSIKDIPNLSVVVPTVLSRELVGHASKVYCLQLLLDGRLASGAADHTIKIWEPASDQCKITLTGHKGSITSILELKDGRIASASQDATIKLWDLANYQVQTLQGHSAFIMCLIQLKEHYLASAGKDSIIKLWDLNSNACIANLIGHAGIIYSIVQLSEGLIASGAEDCSIYLWDLTERNCIKSLCGHKAAVCSLVKLSYGWLASASKDKTIRIWDPYAGVCLFQLTKHNTQLIFLGQLNDEQLIASTEDKTIKIWDFSKDDSIITVPVPAYVYDIKQLQDGRLALASSDHTIKFLSL